MQARTTSLRRRSNCAAIAPTASWQAATVACALHLLVDEDDAAVGAALAGLLCVGAQRSQFGQRARRMELAGPVQGRRSLQLAQLLRQARVRF